MKLNIGFNMRQLKYLHLLALLCACMIPKSNTYSYGRTTRNLGVRKIDQDSERKSSYNVLNGIVTSRMLNESVSNLLTNSLGSTTLDESSMDDIFASSTTNVENLRDMLTTDEVMAMKPNDPRYFTSELN